MNIFKFRRLCLSNMFFLSIVSLAIFVLLGEAEIARIVGFFAFVHFAALVASIFCKPRR